MQQMWRVPLSTLARIDRYAVARRPKNITLNDLERLMALRSKQRRPDAFVREAQWLHEEVPLRMAQLLKHFHRLPFIAMRSEANAKVYDIYLQDFERLTGLPKIMCGEGVLKFKEELKESQRKRAEVISLTRQAVGELSRFPDVQESLETFFHKVFLTRIGRLLLEDHFIIFVDHAITRSDAASLPESDGIVMETKLAPLLQDVANVVRGIVTPIYGHCASIEIIETASGDPATVHSIPRYLHFIFTEIMKNAIKATMEAHPDKPPPVHVTIAKGTYDVQVKISDLGGGMPRRVLNRVWRYGYSGFDSSHASGGGSGNFMSEATSDPQHELSGFGVGLPISRLYMRYLGGDITISQVLGHGTEVSVIINQHGKREEFDVGDSEDYGEDDVDFDMGGARSSFQAP